MSVTCGFYNSKNGDRKYDAIQMSSIFDGIIRDGVLQHYGTAMVVKESEGMMVNVGIGRAWFNHTWTLNDALLPLTVPISEVLLNRIDAVVLEVDARESVRANSIKIIKGTPASSPKNPTMIKTNDRWQYPLAYIRVNAGVTSIRQANITNCVGTSACPFVTAPLEKMSIDALVAQWGDQWKAFYGAQTADMEAANTFWKNQWRTWFQAQTTEIQEAYLNWEHQWEEFFNAHANEITDTAEYWKDMWQKWFYDYVNNSSRELAYWKKLVTDDFTEYSTFWKNQWRTWFQAQTTEIQEAYLNWEHQWEEFFNAHANEITDTAEYWKDMWQKWFYDYVNNSSRELAYWKKLVTDDFTEYSTFWKNQWRTWFQAQTTEIQEAYLNWEHQWEEFFNNQTTEMQTANANWKDLWQAWFYDYVNGNTEEYSAWKNSIDKDFRDWWDSIKELLDGEDISAFANKLVALNERMDKFEEFQNELTNTHSIYDSLNDSSDKAIFDGNNEPIEGKRVTFVVEKESDVGKELEDVKRRLSAIEQAFDGLANEFTVYQILTDGGTWLYVDNPDTDRTEQLLDDKGDVIRGKTIFVTK